MLSTRSTSKRGLIRVREFVRHYAGTRILQRVKTPQAGDLIVWPGHVGTLWTVAAQLLQPGEYGIRSARITRDFTGNRGKAAIYRFKVEDLRSVTVAQGGATCANAKSEGQRGGALVHRKTSAADPHPTAAEGSL